MQGGRRGKEHLARDYVLRIKRMAEEEIRSGIRKNEKTTEDSYREAYEKAGWDKTAMEAMKMPGVTEKRQAEFQARMRLKFAGKKRKNTKEKGEAERERGC